MNKNRDLLSRYMWWVLDQGFPGWVEDFLCVWLLVALFFYFCTISTHDVACYIRDCAVGNLVNACRNICRMKILLVYSTQAAMTRGFWSEAEAVSEYDTHRDTIEINRQSKILSYGRNTWYFAALTHMDHVRGLEYDTWYKMGNFFYIEPKDKDFLDSHCRS